MLKQQSTAIVSNYQLPFIGCQPGKQTSLFPFPFEANERKFAVCFFSTETKVSVSVSSVFRMQMQLT
jgi:hypothetical protein